MSGIILPGQDREPKPEGGIELPKGFTSRRAAEPAEPAAAPAAPEAPAPPKAPPAQRPAARPAAQAGGQAPNFLFPPAGAQITCPNCRTPYVVPVFTIVDLGANPELRAALLGSQINVATCPSCGAGGPLGAPLLVHDPEHSFLGAYVPGNAGRDDVKRQRAIGDLTQALMGKLPAEARKGYMLQPKQYLDWQRLMEQLWEFEGVTAEMLRRQREQAALLQRLAGLANDPTALKLALERGASLVDRDFFVLLDQLILMGRGQNQQEIAPLLQLREQLLELTAAGREVKAQQDRVRAILAQIGPTTSRADLLQLLLSAWDEEDGQELVEALTAAVAPILDYQFLMAVTEKLDTATDEEERSRLIELRTIVVELQEQTQARQRQGQQAAAQRAQALLQEVLQATDLNAALREHEDLVDEVFLGVLAANIRAAEQNKSAAAARRLRQVYDMALAMIQEKMPEEMRLLNQLVSAQDEGSVRQLLKDNRHLLTRDFAEVVDQLEGEMRQGGRKEIADRLKSVRGKIALMM